MPEANSPSKLKETVRERVKENESKRGRQRRLGWFILLKVTVESQPDCLLFFALWPWIRGKSVRFPAGAGGLMKKRDTHLLQELGLHHRTLQLASLSKGGSVAFNVCAI